MGKLEEGRRQADCPEHAWSGAHQSTRVLFKFLIDLVAKDRGSSWMLAEDGGAAEPLLPSFRLRRHRSTIAVAMILPMLVGRRVLKNGLAVEVSF
jgi:hypothetical protein